jgi:hypothetical protein
VAAIGDSEGCDHPLRHGRVVPYFLGQLGGEAGFVENADQCVKTSHVHLEQARHVTTLSFLARSYDRTLAVGTPKLRNIADSWTSLWLKTA